MKSLKQFLDQASVDNPQVGDSIGFELDFESMVESSIVELLEDGVLVDVDDTGIELLENSGFKFEAISRYGAVGNSPGMGHSVAEGSLNEGIPKNATEKKLAELLLAWGFFISFKSMELKNHGVDQAATNELLDMFRTYTGPVINGMKWGEITKGDLWQNPKVIPHLLKYIYQAIPYVEARIKKFVRPEKQAQYLDYIDTYLKPAYKEVVSLYSNPSVKEQGVAEGWNDRLPDPDAYMDYIERLRDLADIRRKEQKEKSDDHKASEKKPPEQPVKEGAMKDLDIAYQDYKRMTPQQFFAAYKMTKAAWMQKHKDLLKSNTMETAPYQPNADANRNDPLLGKSLDDAAVGAMEEGWVDHLDDPENWEEYLERMRELADMQRKARREEMPVPDKKPTPPSTPAKDVEEAKYQGREVPLGKPMQGDVKKSKVYVRKPNGNIVKVNFGDKTMRIKKSNPNRRKSFRARHNCDNPGPRWKARYWSCRAW